MTSHTLSEIVTASMHVAEVAREAGVTPATVRHYARTGLLHAGRDHGNGYRLFSRADVRRVVFIRQAQALGLTLEDIKAILETVDQGQIPCQQVKSLVEQRLTFIKHRLSDLQATASRISAALETWEQTGDWRPVDNELCPLIQRLETVRPHSTQRQPAAAAS